jgi:hypothetical protein
VLDMSGQWHPLPPDPFPAHPFHNPRYNPDWRGRPDSYFDWLRDGVWTGTRLLLIGGPESGPHAAVAALDLDRLGTPAGGWTRLPRLSDPKGRGSSGRSPTFVAGRVVWSNVVYDPASGASTPTPDFGPDVAAPNLGDLPPDGLVSGDRVVLGGTLFDPVSGSSQSCPRALLLTSMDYGKGGGLGLAGAAWAGGPGGVVHFGGYVFGGGYPAGGSAPAVPAALLRPVG